MGGVRPPIGGPQPARLIFITMVDGLLTLRTQERLWTPRQLVASRRTP